MASHFVLNKWIAKTTEFKSISLASNTNQKNNKSVYLTPGCSLSSAGHLPLTWHSASLERCTLWTWEWKPAETDVSHQGGCKREDRWLRNVCQRSFFPPFWWLLMNIKNYPGPVSTPRPPHRWHGYEGHPEGRGKRQSSPSPAGCRAPLSLSYPLTELLSCRRSDQLCNLKRNPDLLLIYCKDSHPHVMWTPQFSFPSL